MVSIRKNNMHLPDTVDLNRQPHLNPVFAFDGMHDSPLWLTVTGMQNTEVLICESFPFLKKPEGWLTELGVCVISPMKAEN